MKKVSDVIANCTGLSRTVLEYSQVMKRHVDSAKQPGFSVARRLPLVELVAIDKLQRVGEFNSGEKIRHIDVCLQMELPGSEVPFAWAFQDRSRLIRSNRSPLLSLSSWNRIPAMQ